MAAADLSPFRSWARAIQYDARARLIGYLTFPRMRSNCVNATALSLRKRSAIQPLSHSASTQRAPDFNPWACAIRYASKICPFVSRRKARIDRSIHHLLAAGAPREEVLHRFHGITSHAPAFRTESQRLAAGDSGDQEGAGS